jgi:chromosome segregation ATPase
MHPPQIAQVAAEAGTPVLVFSLVITGTIIALLLALVAWFAKARVKSRQRYEELMERRLSSGANTMHNLNISVEQLQTKFVEAIGKLLERKDFAAYCQEHSREHDRLDDKLSDTKKQHAELKQSIAEVGVRVESGLAAMTDLLAKLVKIEDRGDN